MKKLLLFLLILVMKFSFAQKQDSISYRGIYIDSLDFKAGKLSYSMNCDLSSGKIKLNHFLCKGYIDVVNGNKKVQLNKDSIFGYKDCKQKDFRFYKECDHEYQIEENKTMVIYIADVPVTPSNGKAIQLVPHYYFSVTLDSEIIPLTIKNLKKAFPDNRKFHDKLDTEISSEKDLVSYDEVHKMYKVNYLIGK